MYEIGHSKHRSEVLQSPKIFCNSVRAHHNFARPFIISLLALKRLIAENQACLLCLISSSHSFYNFIAVWYTIIYSECQSDLISNVQCIDLTSSATMNNERLYTSGTSYGITMSSERQTLHRTVV